MNEQSTTLQLKTKQDIMQLKNHPDMKKNIPVGSLSPLIFCTALIPLTHDLNRADCEYQLYRFERKISG
jgi:hypothetical protein